LSGVKIIMNSNTVHLKNRIMSRDENRELLQQCPVGRIATSDEKGVPYITPVNFVYDPDVNRIYVHHTSKGGKLLNNLKNNNHVCFEIEQAGIVVNVNPASHICDGDQIYRSVIGLGQVSIADRKEMLRGLELLGMKYFIRSSFSQTVQFEPSKLDRLVVLVINIETMTGKCRETRDEK
jgi:nitroimidazol reductase NimA-like FMN-containing flavoprotein (pyridoxamine 5'-phosphate oxidase superfamily)